MGSTPRTGRTRPSRASSPTKREVSFTSAGRAPAAVRMPMAMGTSKAAPSLRRSAGARFTVMRRSGYLKPLFSIAPRMRTRPSFTPTSGRPTMWQPGNPLATSTSTWMGAASMPMTVAERTRVSTWRSKARTVPRLTREVDRVFSWIYTAGLPRRPKAVRPPNGHRPFPGRRPASVRARSRSTSHERFKDRIQQHAANV